MNSYLGKMPSKNVTDWCTMCGQKFTAKGTITKWLYSTEVGMQERHIKSACPHCKCNYDMSEYRIAKTRKTKKKDATQENQ